MNSNHNPHDVIVKCIITNNRGSIAIINADSFCKEIKSWHIPSAILGDTDTGTDMCAYRVLSDRPDSKQFSYRIIGATAQSSFGMRQLIVWYLCYPLNSMSLPLDLLWVSLLQSTTTALPKTIARILQKQAELSLSQ